MPNLTNQTLTIRQGEDKTIVVPIVAGANPVAVIDATEIFAQLYVGGQKVLKFSLTDRTADDIPRLTVTNDAADNLVNIPLSRADTQGFPVGVLSCVLLVNDASEKHTEYELTLGSIEPGKLKDEDASVA